MKVTKKIIGNLEKCYSLAVLEYQNKQHILVAAEKVNKCLLYDLEGNLEETVWNEPGGVMTMVQIPGSNGQFLSTHRFYSPNDSKDASIVIVTPKGKDNWEIRTLVNLPFVHRFGILARNGRNYLIACTVKSDHQYKDDWSSPGKVYGALLPEDLSGFNKNNQLHLDVIKDGMLKNHGYYSYSKNGIESAIVSGSQGVFLYTPPEKPDKKWEIRELINLPASDAVLMDIDEDGNNELVVFSPFHGDTICIYKEWNGCFKKIYEYPEKLEFLHAIFGGVVCGTPMFIAGHRKGDKGLLAFTSNKKGGYKVQKLDAGCGAANVLHYTYNCKDILIGANREIDEIAMYILE